MWVLGGLLFVVFILLDEYLLRMNEHEFGRERWESVEKWKSGR